MSLFQSTAKNSNISVTIRHVFRNWWIWFVIYPENELFNRIGVVRTEQRALDKAKKAVLKIMKYQLKNEELNG